MERDPGVSEKLYRLRLVLPDLSQSFVGNWLASLDKSIPPDLFHDSDGLFDAPEEKSGSRSGDVNASKRSGLEAQWNSQTSARENAHINGTNQWRPAAEKSGKGHELWLRAGELPARGPELHTWEVCHALENRLRAKATGNRQRSSKCDESNMEEDEEVDALQRLSVKPPSPQSQLTNILESDLVRDALYALLGAPAAIRKLERLARVYSTSSADKSMLSTLWTRSVTAPALGKLLSIIARAGYVRSQLDAFVSFFLDDPDDPFEEESPDDAPKLSRKAAKKKSKKKTAGVQDTEKVKKGAMNSANMPGGGSERTVPRHCLVNQAFAAAVKGILRGHVAALNTLAASVSSRRYPEAEVSGIGGEDMEEQDAAGPVIGYGIRDITLLEFYVHTRELRVQLHALAFICLMRKGKSFVGRTVSDACLEEEEDWRDASDNDGELSAGNVRKRHDKKGDRNCCDPLVLSFEKFPRGADLLTYLYDQLTEVDPLYMGLLRFLFESAYGPYSNFVQSWLYKAAVKDPYREFIIEQADFSVASSSSKTHGKPVADPHPRDLKLRSGLYVPRFMENICTPLIRAGEQLQVLLKLTETCELAQQMANNARSSETFWPRNSTGSPTESIENSPDLPALVFSKRKLEEIAKQRERRSQQMSEKFDILFTQLAARHAMERSRASSHFGTPTNLTLDASHAEVADEEVLLEGDPEPQQEPYEEPLSNIPGIQGVQDRRHLGVTVTIPKRGWVTSVNDEPVVDDSQSHSTDRRRNLWQAANKDGPVRLAMAESEETENQPTGLALDPRDPIELWFNTDPINVSKVGKSSDGGSEVQSLISGYQRGTSWQLWGLPLNPFLVQADVEDSEPNAYVYPIFTGTYQHWDVSAKPTFVSVTGLEKSRCSSKYGRDVSIEPSWFPQFELALNEQLFAGLDAQVELPSWSQADLGYAGDEAGQSGLNGFHDQLPVEFDLGPTDSLCVPAERHLVPDARKSSPLTVQPKPSNALESSSPHVPIDSTNIFSDPHVETETLTDLPSPQSIHTQDLSQPMSNSEIVDENYVLSPPIMASNFKQDPSGNVMIEPCTLNVEESDLTKTQAKNMQGIPQLLKHSDLGAVAKDGNVSGSDQGNVSHSSKQINCQSWESDDFRGPARWLEHMRFLESPSANAIQETADDSSDEDDVCAEEIPLSVVVSKCIAEEILSQYQSVSTLTVRLFQEGLCLQDHYTTLRRYYFMERGDWAEYFTTALCQHRWGPLGGQLRQMEVQGMLEAACQKSSCEGDTYGDRVSVTFQKSRYYCENLIQESTKMSTSYVDVSRLDAFDFIALQYRVDWPLSLILTNHSLCLYNVVFTFLLRIKLTVHALGDVWQRLQSIDRSLHKSRMPPSSQQQRNRFRTLQQFRQQIYHFVTTLQRYVESKLLSVVWSKFLQDIQLEVNDMQDLEIVHRAYLEEATEECFLSTKTRGVKGCIDSIMQCVLDFSSHMRNAYWSRDKLDLIDDTLFMQVHQVKKGFQASLQQLHSYHTKQDPQSRTNLNDLWMILDYNGFLTRALSPSHL